MKRLSFIFIFLFLAAACNARIITVDDDGPADFNNIQAAIDDCNNGDVVIIAPGTYTGRGNRDIDFHGKAITVCSIDPNDPNIVAATIVEGSGFLTSLYHGFTLHSSEGRDSIIAGLTVRTFWAPVESAMGGLWVAGGGIFCKGASPTISYCVIESNCAYFDFEMRNPGFGGGIFSDWSSKPLITHCTIRNNYCYLDGGGIFCGNALISNTRIEGNRGAFGTGGIYGGIVIDHCIIERNNSGFWVGGISSNGTITNSRISNNSGTEVGGGVYCGGVYGSPLISNCIINGNSVGAGRGGGIHCGEGARVINCLVVGNSARTEEYFGEWVEGEAGGIYCNDANVLVSNSTIVGNWADANGGGIYGNPTITNSIVWGNNCPNEPQISGVPNISYSNVQSGWLGEGNIDTDPCFADPNNGDYHLKSQAGRWDANEGRWTKDEGTSPCIDAGDPKSPIGLEPFPNGGIINMGSYGGTVEASKSYFGEPVCETVVAGDINGDCIVNLKDFAIMALHWLDEH